MPSVHQVPAGYELRDAIAEDAPAIAELINEVCVAEIGLPWTTAEQTRDALTSPGRDPELSDAVLLAGGKVVGYLEFDVTPDPLQVEMLGFVRTRLAGRGLNAWLLRLGEERARRKVERERPREPTPLRVASFTGNEPARRLFTALGYRYVRTFWMMRIELDVPPPVPRVPDGIVIRTLEPGRDEAGVHAALTEGFAEHWGGAFPSFEEWRHFEIEGEGSSFDPSLWFLATDGDEIVGAATCQASTPRATDTAQVGELAVRRPWRRRGIALALLHTAFGEFHRRGIPRAELGVDAENPTGATHLYERAGMREVYSWEFWEKHL